MKKFKVFWALLFVLILSTTIVSAFDSVQPGHNSNFYLQYGSGSTICVDSSSAHSYMTTGNAHDTYSSRLIVYILNASGITIVSDSSTSYSTYANAWWTREYATAHGHRAMSGLVQ